ARSGMDEFVVVLPETGEEEASALADRLRERVMGLGFAGGAIGLSAGVAQMKPDETLSAEGFLRRAERVLSETKRQEHDWNALWTAEQHRARR
ncbi:MAG: diguanylate cyclase, partial [Chloroflexi bacterium]|nr:diguanylate cyclase [Chloroflexota bacterium]